MARQAMYATVLMSMSCVIAATVSSACKAMVAICERTGPATSMGVLATATATATPRLVGVVVGGDIVPPWAGD